METIWIRDGKKTSQIRNTAYIPEYHSVCPLVGIGTPPTSSPASEWVPPLNERGWGAHSPVGEGVWESRFR